MNLEAAKVMKPRRFRTRRWALHAFPMRRGTGTPTVPSGSGWQRVGGCFLTRRHGGAEKHAENMFGLASVLGTQRRKVKTGERGVSGDPTAAQRGSRWGGRPMSHNDLLRGSRIPPFLMAPGLSNPLKTVTPQDTDHLKGSEPRRAAITQRSPRPASHFQ